jgi:hypothetical protein
MQLLLLVHALAQLAPLDPLCFPRVRLVPAPPLIGGF